MYYGPGTPEQRRRLLYRSAWGGLASSRGTMQHGSQGGLGRRKGKLAGCHVRLVACQSVVSQAQLPASQLRACLTRPCRLLLGGGGHVVPHAGSGWQLAALPAHPARPPCPPTLPPEARPRPHLTQWASGTVTSIPLTCDRCPLPVLARCRTSHASPAPEPVRQAQGAPHGTRGAGAAVRGAQPPTGGAAAAERPGLGGAGGGVS